MLSFSAPGRAKGRCGSLRRRCCRLDWSRWMRRIVAKLAHPPYIGTSPGSTSIYRCVGQNWSFRLDGFIGAPRRPSARGINHLPDIRVQCASRGTRGSVQRLDGIGERRPSALRTVLRLGCESCPLQRNPIREHDRTGVAAQRAQVVKINVMLSASGDAAQGTYTITGGCGAGPAEQSPADRSI